MARLTIALWGVELDVTLGIPAAAEDDGPAVAWDEPEE